METDAKVDDDVLDSTPTASKQSPTSEKDVVLSSDDIIPIYGVINSQAGDDPEEVRKAIRSLERTVQRYRRLLIRVMKQTKTVEARGGVGTGNSKPAIKAGMTSPNENSTRRSDKVKIYFTLVLL
jgi:hypothetical protein